MAHHPLTQNPPAFRSDNSNIAAISMLLEAALSSAEAFLKKAQQSEITAGSQDKELLEAIKHIREQTLAMERYLSVLREHTRMLGPGISSSEHYIAQTMSTILPKLPELILATRMGKIDKELERYVEILMPADPLRDVMLAIEDNNIEMQKAFVRENWCMTSKDINRLSGQSSVNPSQTASRWKSKGLIFSVDYFGTDLFPAFQFEAGKPKLIIKKVLDILSPYRSPWQIAYWFIDENVWLENARPIDVLESRGSDVLHAARVEIEPSYH